MWYKYNVLMCAFALIVVSTGANEEPPDSRLVRTAQGPVRGYRDPEGVFAFYGIPYATVPTGRHKFRAPLPPPMWLETLDAVDKGVICPQIQTPFIKDKEIKEDCLIANVYVPDTDETNLPVVVYVHGGAYQIGYGNLMTPKSLVRSQNIIAITFNYRLGAHGFLCLGTSDAPGNAALKDQVAALRWVKRNIAKFGGNANDITIAGFSAGSKSVDLLGISDMANGLFNKVIAESGSHLGPALVMSPLDNAKIFAKSLNFTDLEDVYALEEFYKTVSLEELVKTGVMDRPDSTILFGPCVERKTDGQEFITETPFNLLKKGKFQKYPMLYGMSNMEGLLRLPYYNLWKVKMNENFADFLPGEFEFKSHEEKEAVAKDVKEFYFGDNPVGDESILQYINYFGDIIYVYPMIRALKMYVEAGHKQMYFYEYSFVDDDTPPVPNTDIRGANHCAQTGAVLDGKTLADSSETDVSEDTREMKKIMRDLWGNFIKTGKPVPEGSGPLVWPSANAAGAPYMSLTLPPQLLQVELLATRMQFWDGLYERYYRGPSPPPTPPTRHTEL